jgi:hypothetical protein
MTDQPEALRLADKLERGTYLLSVERNNTAAELRRLHAEVERLREVAGQALAFTLRGFSTVRDFDAARAVMHDALRAALKETK